MPMGGSRSFQSSTGYRYGMNGKEKDDEISGDGNSYDFGARQNDPRLGRWWSTDPKGYKYPYMSPYVAFGNSPNYYIDPGGETLRVAITENSNNDFKARRDIESLLPDGKSSLIKFEDDGTVKFTVSMEQAKAMAAKDPGIGLVYDLVTVEETIVYEVNQNASAKQDGEVVNKDLFIPNNLQVDNQSITPPEKRNMKHRAPIEEGVDGKVVVDPNLDHVNKEGTTSKGDGTYIKKNREAIVFHELAENLERTSKKFGKKNFDGAHAGANKRQDKMQTTDRRRDGNSGSGDLSIEPSSKKSSNTKSKPILP
jgi:RHS repeat-associated protein